MLISGIVIVNKPKGPTSHDVVQRVKRLYHAAKAGHTGTLDPIATGVLPVCLNRATKLATALSGDDKEYLVDILLGVATTTYDMEGDIVSRGEPPPDLKKRLGDIIREFTGVIEQSPPYFSAVKYKGRPLYKWARAGKFIDLPPRKIEIKLFQVEKFEPPAVVARIHCSKGTYIRSLCHDLGRRLRCGAAMKGLSRLASGRFRIEDAVALSDLEACKNEEELAKYVFTNMDLLC